MIVFTTVCNVSSISVLRMIVLPFCDIILLFKMICFFISSWFLLLFYILQLAFIFNLGGHKDCCCRGSESCKEPIVCKIRFAYTTSIWSDSFINPHLKGYQIVNLSLIYSCYKKIVFFRYKIETLGNTCIYKHKTTILTKVLLKLSWKIGVSF